MMLAKRRRVSCSKMATATAATCKHRRIIVAEETSAVHWPSVNSMMMGTIYNGPNQQTENALRDLKYCTEIQLHLIIEVRSKFIFSSHNLHNDHSIKVQPMSL